MDIDTVIYNLQSKSTRANFDAWVSTNIKELTDFFYTLSKSDLKRLDFDQKFYYGQFVTCPVFLQFEKSRQESEPFNAFLFMLAATLERLAELGLGSPIRHLVNYLPLSPVYYRLQALICSQNIDDIKTDYLLHFPEILQLLQESDEADVESQTQRIIDFLIYFYDKAKENLVKNGYTFVLQHLKNEYCGEENIIRYRFLGDASLVEYINGEGPQDLKTEEVDLEVLYPTLIMENHFKYNVNLPVLKHPNSRGYDLLMGYEKSVILNKILDRGKTTFDDSYEAVTSDEKVLLYCYFNMKKHFFTSMAAYKKVWATLEKFVTNREFIPTFIDLGCGPITSGLALADLFYTKTETFLKLRYIGIDISNAMLKKAKEFTESDIFHQDSDFSFYSSWNVIDQDLIKIFGGINNPIIFNASYLFANLNREIVDDLIIFIKKISVKYKNVYFIFQNPDRIDRNVNWEVFKREIGNRSLIKTVEQVIYKSQRSAFREPGTENVYCEILKF